MTPCSAVVAALTRASFTPFGSHPARAVSTPLPPASAEPAPPRKVPQHPCNVGERILIDCDIACAPGALFE